MTGITLTLIAAFKARRPFAALTLLALYAPLWREQLSQTDAKEDSRGVNGSRRLRGKKQETHTPGLSEMLHLFKRQRSLGERAPSLIFCFAGFSLILHRDELLRKARAGTYACARSWLQTNRWKDAQLLQTALHLPLIYNNFGW